MGIFENRSLVSSDRLKRLLLFVLFLLSGLMLLVGCHEDQEEEVISSIYNEDDLKYEDSLKQYLRNTYPSVINKEEFYKLKYCSTVVYMVPRA